MVRRNLRSVGVVRFALCAALFGCSGGGPVEEGAGAVTLDLSTAPVDARCLQLTILQGATTTTKKVSVGPNEPAAFVASGLPVGSVTLSEQVFTQACASVTTAKWVSDTQAVTLVAGQALAVTFNLRLATAAGIVNVNSNFPDPSGGFQRLTAVTSTSVTDTVLGPGDAIWGTTSGSTQTAEVFKVDTAGVVSSVASFSTGAGTDGPLNSIAFGPDRRLWIGRETGVMRLDPLNPVIRQVFLTPTANPRVSSIVVGPDNNLWFTEWAASKIGRITVAGIITEWALAASQPDSIVPGPDGNLWFVESNANKIGKITTAGAITEYTIPTAGSVPRTIVAGPDGNLWFSGSASNKIGKVTTAGAFTEYALTTPASEPWGITVGADGNLWFGRVLGLGRITTAGIITEFNGFSTASSRAPRTGADSKLYFDYYESSSNVGGLARIEPGRL